MKRGNIPISKDFELEYRYYDKDQNFKYFNRKFEIFLLEKKHLNKNYVLHIDNANTTPGDFAPHVYIASNISKQLKQYNSNLSKKHHNITIKTKIRKYKTTTYTKAQLLLIIIVIYIYKYYKKQQVT